MGQRVNVEKSRANVIRPRLQFNRRRALNRKMFQIELGAFLRICEGFNTPRSLACYMLAKYGEWEQYLDLPRAFFDDEFPENYGVSEIMRKNPRLPIAVDRRAVALEKFRSSEQQCAETNERFRKYPLNSPEGLAEVPNLTDKVKGIIAGILGPLVRRDPDGKIVGSSSTLTKLDDLFRFGPGSTSDVTGRMVLLSNKMAQRKYCATPRLATFRSGFCWPGADVKLRSYSKVTTVPKTALTDRTIAIEPHWNVYVQLGVGQLIRRRLERSGLQCSDQQHNRQAALIARKCGWATIDLSAASDTIASSVVEALLPSDWFELLYLCRTDYALLPGESQPTELEKFSSMGNGFTWELETLIFWAIARAVAQETGESEWDTLAYGDDIIVPQRCVPLLVRALNHYGFSVNSKKSFWQGDFFESCGTDVFRGLDIRPFFMKEKEEDIDELETPVIRLANAIRRYSHRLGCRAFCDSRLQPAYRYVVAQLPKRARRTGIPEGYGDEGLVKNFDEVLAHVRRPANGSKRAGWEGWLCDVLHRQPVTSDKTCIEGAYNAALRWGTPGSNSRCIESTKGRLRPPQRRSMLVPRWTDLGPWL